MRTVPDKSFMSIPRDRRHLDTRYKDGIEAFLAYSDTNPLRSLSGSIFCPCKNCRNGKMLARSDVSFHLSINGFDSSYVFWSHHGEGVPVMQSEEEFTEVSNPTVDTTDMLEDILAAPSVSDVNTNDMSQDVDRLMRLVEENESPLYEGCKEFTRLSFMLRLIHIQTLSGMAVTHFEMLLDLLRKVIPGGEKSIPATYYEAHKIVDTLGLDYKKIDACPNDCILYNKGNEALEECPTCHVSRWKGEVASTSEGGASNKQNRIPAKVLRYFPIIPRLQRFYMSAELAENMRWHSTDRKEDGKLRHPADGEAWKHIDRIYPDFGKESRNIRLGLASDGFNPFGLMSSAWSTWPVLLTPYNMPPSMCMKQPYMILSLLIPGRYSPGNDIDVFLQPLIDDLKLLWEKGVSTYDAYGKESFCMRAMVMWTINDFPAYANLSGWSTKGQIACPICMSDYEGKFLKYSRKFCYWQHRRWLPTGHKFRKLVGKFDGNPESRPAPPRLTGEEIFELLHPLPRKIFGKKRFNKENPFGVRRKILKQKWKGKGKSKGNKPRNVQSHERVSKGTELPHGWSKFSIFYQLPYWRSLKIRHNLDVMHIEKNICENLLNTLLQDGKKSKDDLRARRDLAELNIRPELQAIDKGDGKFELPASRVTLSKDEVHNMCLFLKSVKTPDGYASNISANVHIEDRKILGLKTHDHHILLHQLLPVALRHADKELAMVVIEFCGFFKQLCSKVIDVREFEELEGRVANTLCKMEILFPPSFFTVMVHLTIHLAYEARIAGPVQYRWMYPVERYLLL